MVKLNKSLLPEGTSIRNKIDYQTGPVFRLLYNDCYGKCYICEQKPIPPVVEHIIAHKGNPSLEFNWHNMFLACYYCNNVKNKALFYDGIVNPLEIDPEDFIILELSLDDLKEKVSITLKCESESIAILETTIVLLDMVYNSSSNRDNQRVSSAHLKNKISKCIRKFYL